MESFVVLVQCQPFHFYSLVWSNGKNILKRFRSRTSHSKIATNDEPYCKGDIERIILDFWKRSYGNQNPWSTNAEKKDRRDPILAVIEILHLTTIIMSNLWKVSPQQATQSAMRKLILRCANDRERPDVTSWWATREIRPGFSHEEIRLDGTAQSVRNEETPRDRSGRPDIDSQEEATPQQFVIGNDEAELELSVESRSFVNRVNDQVRKRQKQISNVTEDGEEHSVIWWTFMTVTMESAEFIGKDYLNTCQSIANTTDLTLKQMFDISTRLVSEQDEISGLETIGCENHSWKYLSLIGEERVINLQRTKVYVFSDSVLCLGKIFENPNRTVHGKIDWRGSKVHWNTETWT